MRIDLRSADVRTGRPRPLRSRRSAAAFASHRRRNVKKHLVLAVLVALVALVAVSPAAAHPGGYLTNRFDAQMQVRSLLMDNGWFVTNLRCGSSSWITGI